MASTKVTFTLDDATLTRLTQAATRLSIPKSEVVREAIAEFHQRIGRLSEREKQRMLHAFDEWLPRLPVRAPAGIQKEIRDIRRARRQGGRRTNGG